MPNSIALFENYINQLDEVYKVASKSAILDTPNVASMLTKAGKFKVPKMTMDGLGDYKRAGSNNAATGYAAGNVTLEFEEKAADYDRGRKFEVDAMDDEESAGVAFGMLSSEFIRTKVVPELDAYRFAKYAGLAKTKKPEAIASGDDLVAALSAAVTAMKEDEVPGEGLYLFITPTLAQLIRNLDTTKSREIMSAFTGVVEVPQTRFYTAIDLKDGKTSGETAGYFAKDTDGKDINFEIVSKSAIMQLTKHTVNKIFTPEENQNADAWQFCFRAYGLCDAYDNKKAGIYVSHKAS